MRSLRLMMLSGCLVLTACKGAPPAAPAAASSGGERVSRSYDPATPPTAKEVLRELLRIQDVKLASDPSCSGVGVAPTDSDVGDYISGFLAEQNSSKGGNSIEVSTKDEPGSEQDRAWRSAVTIRHLDGEDRWGWGVSFLMKPTDHSVVKGSVRCTGAG